MKKKIATLALIMLISNYFYAQDSNWKYGKVTIEELKMTSYENDSTAPAVKLHEEGYTTYEIQNSTFVIQQEVKQRIKILKQSGLDYANIIIPYYYGTPEDCEIVSDIEAYSYNLQNGEIVKTKLDKKYIFIEEFNKYTKRIKFSIPNVRIGSVIEFKYDKLSRRFWDLPTWTFQCDIPVDYSSYELRIPEYLIFSKETHGFEKIEFQESEGFMRFVLNDINQETNTATCTSKDLKFIARKLPALHKEPYVWCKNEFLASASFEIKATNFPNSFYKSYSQTWDDLEKLLINESDFGKNLKLHNPYEDAMTAILDTATTQKSKIENIYTFIKKQIKWNGEYELLGNNWKDAVKNKTGNNAQINMILMSMLKSTGIHAFPIVMRERSLGRLPYTYPSVDKLTTFIVAAQTMDGQTYYMDGSASFGGLNMLPSDLLVDKARAIDNSLTDKWIDLTKITRNKCVHVINSELNADGILVGNIKSAFTNELAYDLKSKFHSFNDSTSYIEKLEEEHGLKIESFSTTGNWPMSNYVEQLISFKKTIDPQGQFLYLNPMPIVHLGKNPFEQSDRKLPIEFDMPYSFQITNTIKIPENYNIEELPKSTKINLMDGSGVCLFQVAQEENNIQLNYKFELKQVLFSQLDYESIKNFFAQVATKNSEMIVLKKK